MFGQPTKKSKKCQKLPPGFQDQPQNTHTSKLEKFISHYHIVKINFPQPTHSQNKYETSPTKQMVPHPSLKDSTWRVGS